MIAYRTPFASFFHDAGRAGLPGIRLAALLILFLPLAGECIAQRTPASPEVLFTDALHLYEQRLYERAAPAFRHFREAYPDHINRPEALYYEAQSMLALGHEETAVGLFEEFSNTYPEHPLSFEARLALGTYFFEKKDYPRALETLERVLADAPLPELSAKALYWMGESAAQLERYEDAIGYFNRAAEAYPATRTAPVALYAVAYTEVRRGRYDAAADAFERLGDRYPNSPYARNLGLALAEVYYELDDYARTADEIKRRLPNLEGEALERGLFLLAEASNQLRRSDDAILYYRRLTEEHPGSPYERRALFGLAWNYYTQQAYQWAAAQFDRVREGHDDALATEATYYAGVNHKLAEEPRRAIDLYAEVVTRWPNAPLAPRALYEMGMTYYELHMWQQANDAFSRLVTDYPDAENLGEALYQQGITSVALGNFDASLRSFDRAIALDAAPRELKDEIVFQKAWLLYRNGAYAEAATAFMGLLETNPHAAKADEALFWAAESFFQTGDLDRSIQLFREYLHQYPDGAHPDAAHYALGWAFFKQSRYADAAKEFETFLDAYRDAEGSVPYRTDARLRLADAYFALKRYPEAIRIYSRVAEDGEDYALYQIGQALMNTGEAFDAITTFRQLLVDYPQSDWREEAQYSLGYLYFQNEEYERAIQEYQTLIDEFPRDPLAAKAQYGIGDAYFNAGQLEASVSAYEAVLNRYPESPFAADAASGIQYALIAMDDAARAEEIINSFAETHPDSPVVDELRFRQAEARFQSGDTDAALRDLQLFVRTARHPEFLPEAYFYLGTIYADRGQVSEASSYLRTLLDQFPASPRRAEAAWRLGDLLLEQDRSADALEVFRTMERVNPSDTRLVARARYGQSRALLALGRASEAETLLKEAMAAAPDSPEAHPALLGLARIYAGDGRTGEALTMLRRLVDQSRDESGAEALVRLGELLLAQGDASGAVDALSRLPVLFAGYSEWVARGYLVQARAYLALNQKGEAARVYDLVIDQFRDTPYAQTATREKAAL